MEFSGVRPPKLAMVTAESVGLLKRSSSEQVPKNTLPFFWKRALRPVPVGGGTFVDVEPTEDTVVVGGGTCALLLAGKHWKYQALSSVQTNGESQVVDPVHPSPPPKMLWSAMRGSQTKVRNTRIDPIRRLGPGPGA